MPDRPPKERHAHMLLEFPKEFLWGTATSAHQVEGDNTNSDWWNWEKHFRSPEFHSGKAANHYNLYAKDFDLAKSLGHNSHRLSIEWSRIEPEEGVYSLDAIEHYKNVLKDLKAKGFTTMLTLWHFTLPLWVAKKGGWENPKTVDYFERFLKKVVPEIKADVDLWVTINEPSIYAYMAYVVGFWPPRKKSKVKAFFVLKNLADAHKKAYKLIHQQNHNAKVGIANNVQSYESYHKHSIREQLMVIFNDRLTNHLFYYLSKGTHDFLGINYYFHHRFNKKGKLITKIIDAEDQYRNASDLGWEVYPEGIFQVLSDLSNHVPIYITECGIASTNDDRRTRFLIQMLTEVYRAIKAGVKVKGFFYWSLLDNFEWHQGFDPRFGLIEVKYATQERLIRHSAYVYAEIIRNNGIPHSLLRLLGHTVTVAEVLCYLHDEPKALCEHKI